MRPPGEGQPPAAVALVTWVPDTGELAGWQVEGVLVANDERLTFHELLVRPRNRDDGAPGAGVTTSVLRAVPLGGLLSAARAALMEGPRQVASWEEAMGQPFATLKAQAEQAAAAVQGTDLKRGRKGFPDDHYRWVALKYLDLQDQGWSKGILEELAEAAGPHLKREYPVARATARDWVATARARGFLTKATQGRAGADPGPNLYKTTNEGES